MHYAFVEKFIILAPPIPLVISGRGMVANCGRIIVNPTTCDSCVQCIMVVGCFPVVSRIASWTLLKTNYLFV